MSALDGTLKKLDIDPRRYRLLLDLFEKLSVRKEFSLGRGGNTIDLEFLEKICLLITTIIGLLAALIPPISIVGFLGIFLVWTTVVLLAVLIPEVAYTLINPVEGLVLAHQPINGATYTAAKLTRLGRLVFRWGPRMNVVPALAGGIFHKDGRWFYPIVHIVAISALGVLVALLCCSVFGLLIRFVAPTRLKSVMRWAQLIFILLITGPRFLAWLPNVARRYVLSLLPGLPKTGITLREFGIGVVAVLAVTMVFGLRSLSTDYLIRVHSIVHGDSAGTRRFRRSRIGEAISNLCGGQVSRAGFEYVRRMILRDWEFMRRAVRMWPMAAGIAGLLLGAPSPFLGRFSPVHLAPHLIGGTFLWISVFLVYGSEYKASWVFLIVSHRAYRRFVRGVHLSLWIPFVLIPHLIALVVRMWAWGFLEAFAFVIFSAAVASIYLSIDLRRIDGIPFSKQVSPPKGFEIDQLVMLIVRLLAVGLAVGVQYFLIFRSPAIVIITSLGLWYVAYLSTRSSLDYFDTSIRYNLSLLSTGSALYEEV